MAFTKVIRTRRSKVSDSVDSGNYQRSLPLDPITSNIANEVDLITEKPLRVEDEIDSPERRRSSVEEPVKKQPIYGYGEAFWSIVAIVSYIADMGSDIFVASMYFWGGKWWYFGLTVGFAVASSLTVLAVSLTWYKHDSTRKTTSRKKWLLRIVLHVLQLGPVLRYVDTIRYGIRSRRSNGKTGTRDWYREKVYEDADASLLRLFECYLEAAPQLTLQLYIILADGFSEQTYLAVGQGVCCVTSLTSIAWALTSYSAALRFSLHDKADMSSASIAVMFFWRLFGVTGRVLALALFASMFHFRVSFVIVFHFVVMLLWLLSQDTKLCSSKATEVIFVVVVAMLCTFDYFNVIEGHTRLRYLFFYILLAIENVAMVLVFLFINPENIRLDIHVVYSLMGLILLLHVVAVLSQLLYYAVVHPNNSGWNNGRNRIRKCVPCSELFRVCQCRKLSKV